MTTQSVSYTSTCQINCGGLPADVILCVPAAKVESSICPPGNPNDPEVLQAYSRSYIEATLIAINVTPLGCSGAQSFKHVFTYDDEQLRPANMLGAGDITGVLCKNCMVQYVNDKAGDETYIRTDDESNQFFVSQHGCEYPILGGACSYVSVVDFGAVPDGVTDSTEAFQAALDTGQSVCVPEGVFRVSQISINTVGQNLVGAGLTSIIKALDPAVDMILFGAEYVSIYDLMLYGIAANAATTGHAISSLSNVSSRFSLIERVGVLSDDPALGFNNGVLFGVTADGGNIISCDIERLQGSSSGRGTAIEFNCPGISVIGNKLLNNSGPGRGRHGILAQSIAPNNASLGIIDGNDVVFFDYDGIIQISQGTDPPCFGTKIVSNNILQCCAVQDTSSAGINIVGHSQGALVDANVVLQSAANGILVDGTGVTDSIDTTISNNVVEFSRFWGITVISSSNLKISDNFVHESSAIGSGLYSNIELRTDGVTACDQTLVEGNMSFGVTTARAAFEINPAVPKATNTKIIANYFPQCFTGQIILTGAIASIDGRLQNSSIYDPPNIANNASFSAAFSVPGAAVGDICGVTHTEDLTGMTLFGFVDSTDSVTVVFTNNSGGAKDVGSGTLNIDVWKRDL